MIIYHETLAIFFIQTVLKLVHCRRPKYLPGYWHLLIFNTGCRTPVCDHSLRTNNSKMDCYIGFILWTSKGLGYQTNLGSCNYHDEKAQQNYLFTLKFLHKMSPTTSPAQTFHSLKVWIWHTCINFVIELKLCSLHSPLWLCFVWYISLYHKMLMKWMSIKLHKNASMGSTV